jgi:hypothetical protein
MLKLWFNSIDRLIESFVVFAAWLFKRLLSGSGNGRLILGQSSSGSSNGCLVLAMVLSYLPAYLPAYLPTCLPACLLVSVSDLI